MYKPNARENLKRLEKQIGKGIKKAPTRAYMTPAGWFIWHAVLIEMQPAEFPDCHQGEETSARTTVEREENPT